MKILALDTTGKTCSVAIAEDEQILVEHYVHDKMTHSQILLPMVDACLREAHLKVGEIDVFGVTVGPGSFTGVRIGVLTAKALAHAKGKPIAAIDTLDALALQAGPYPSKICPMLDARRGQVYAAVYLGGKKVIEDRAVAVEEMLKDLADEEAPLFLGDGAVALCDVIRSYLPAAVFAPSHLTWGRASACATLAYRAAQAGNLETYQTVKPFYLRESGAVRKRMGNDG